MHETVIDGERIHFFLEKLGEKNRRFSAKGRGRGKIDLPLREDRSGCAFFHFRSGRNKSTSCWSLRPPCRLAFWYRNSRKRRLGWRSARKRRWTKIILIFALCRRLLGLILGAASCNRDKRFFKIFWSELLCGLFSDCLPIFARFRETESHCGRALFALWRLVVELWFWIIYVD